MVPYGWWHLIAAASVVTQVVGLLSVGFMVFDIATLPPSLIEQAGSDTARVQQYILETIFSYRAWIGVGMVGAIVAWLLILKNRYRAAWFLRTSRVIAWSWMPLFPIGTGLGVLVLSARAAAIADTANGQS